MHEDQNSVTIYLQSIAKVPLLTRQQELQHGYAVHEGRKKIASTLSKKNLKKLAEIVQNIDDDDEEKPQLLALLATPNADNIKLLKEYVTHIDFDVLVKYCEGMPRLQPIVGSIRRSREALISANLRLVVSVAKQYTNAGLPFLDLISEGNIGLVKAVDKFRPELESKLATLAVWWIRQAIIRSLSNKSRVIRVPVHLVDGMSRAYKKLSKLYSRTPTPEEMLKELKMPNLTLTDIKFTMDVMAGPVPLQQTVGDGEEGGITTYEHFLRDPAELADVALVNKDFKQKLLELFETLSPREAKVIRLKLGI